MRLVDCICITLQITRTVKPRIIMFKGMNHLTFTTGRERVLKIWLQVIREAELMFVYSLIKEKIKTLRRVLSC